MNQLIEANNGFSRKQENGETTDDVIFVENETLPHVNIKNSEPLRGQPRTQKSIDFLTLTGNDNSNLDNPNHNDNTCGCSSNRAYSTSSLLSCKPVCIDEKSKSSGTELCASGTSNTCSKLISNRNGESYAKTRSNNDNNANIDFLLSSFYSFSSSSMVDTDESPSVNRSHPIIAHILTGEDKNLGKDQSRCSPDRNKSTGPVVKDVSFPIECHENSDKSDTEDDVDSFIDEAICKNLMAEKLEVTGEWEIGNRLESPANVLPTTQSSDPVLTERRTVLSLIIADGKIGSELKQVISQAMTNVSSVKVVSPTEALNTCNTEEFHLVWIHILPDLVEEFVSLSTAIRCTSKKNGKAILIALTEKSSEGEVKLQSFDTVLTLPISKETIQQMYIKQQWILGKDISESERSIVSPALSIESIRTSERSQSSQCESGTGTFDLNDIPLMEIKNLASDSKLSSMVDMNSYRKRRERIKDSCDQLRVLLPYVRGRKTDMASILEMTVDYLRIITAALPQDFQSQIINIMSNGNSLPPCEIYKKNKSVKIPTQNISPLIKQSSADKKNNCHPLLLNPEPKTKFRIMTRSVSKSESSLLDDRHSSGSGNEKHSETHTSLSGSLKKTKTKLYHDVDHVVKRECLSTEGSGVKRTKVQVLPSYMEPIPSKSVCLPTSKVSTLQNTKKEIFGEMVTQVSSFPNFSFPPKVTDSDMAVSHVYTSSQMGNDVFQLQQHSHVNNLTSGLGHGERDASQFGGLFMDGNYYTYFPLVENSSAGLCIPSMSGNYVSPTAVLSMTNNLKSGSFGIATTNDQTINDTEQIKINPATNLFNVSVVKNNNLSGLN
ncbi:uncharacterized protein LOC129926056 isoform X2 [Biomphalaria glabrata]|uniref:Uncharacterized protein LOC129926056 isoform X2 n=1 Tax=Biomphalaria glabrata TaxID=6526 RepID=A0A9W3A9J7_BIOGL|nr:uncharacterized protein LOC129926056 isoform X2 [Biomphalaria glabrata]